VKGKRREGTPSYDGAGNLITKTTPNTDKKGGAINYVYDNSRLITVTYKDASPVKYTYGNTGDDANGAGRIVKTETSNCTDEYRYDWMGNVVWNKRTIKGLDGETTSYTSNYKYDYFGRMKSITLPNKKTTTYGYDKGGQLAAVSGSDTRYVSGIKYNATGQRTAETSGDGTITTYDYNPENHRLKTLETKRKGTTVQNISYEYDDVGNITERTSEMMGSDNRMKKTTHEYTYDDNDRLTEGEGSVKGSGLLRPTIVSYKSSYTYNAIGNILNKNQSVNGGESSLSGNDTYEYGAKQPHAVTKAGSMVFTYDDNGNMVTRENTNTKNTMTLVWDDENRLVQTKDNFHKTDYRYDASGERIIKKSELGETQYISANYIVRNKTVVSTHIFAGNQRIASTVGIKDSCGNVTEQNTLYYHADHLGSSSYVTNQSGEFYEMIEYLPYGETLYDEQTVSSVSYKYTGKEQDAETGLYYYGARYYDAKLCKFISTDAYLANGKYFPTGNKEKDTRLPGMGGVFNSTNINAYQYADNNPIKYNDPSGNETKSSKYEQWWVKGTLIIQKLDYCKVQKGDTLSKIAKNQLKSMEKSTSPKDVARHVEYMKQANGLQGDTIKPGQELFTGFTLSKENGDATENLDAQTCEAIVAVYTFGGAGGFSAFAKGMKEVPQLVSSLKTFIITKPVAAAEVITGTVKDSGNPIPDTFYGSVSALAKAAYEYLGN